MKTTFLIVFAILFFNACSPSNEHQEPQKKQDPNKFEWVKKYKAIICLTYDDGMETQFKNAIPQLDSFGFKGTFFLNNVINQTAIVEWRKASKAGHELGNHTLFHPCPKDVGWPKEVTSDYYSVDQILDEVKVVNSILDVTELKKSKRSFAYPCNSMIVGNESYKEALEESNLVTYARNGMGNQKIIPMALDSTDLMNVPSWSVAEGTTFEELKSYVDHAVDKNGIGIFQFHGIGGQWLNVSSDTHLQLLQYLKDKEDGILVMTFSEAMKYLESL